MKIQNIINTLKFFPRAEKYRLILFFLKKKFFRRANLSNSYDIIRKFSQLLKLVKSRTIKITKKDENFIWLEYLINNKTFYTIIRRNTSDIDVYLTVIANEEYKSISTIKIDQCGFVVDAGANIGFTSFYINAYFPNALIACIEPDPENCNLLRRNILINGLENKIKVLENALWIDMSTLVINNKFRDGAAWSKSVMLPTQSTIEGETKVKGITISQLFDEFFVSEVQLMKIDIEGAEKVLFLDDNFTDVIKSSCKHLIIEIHDEFECRENIYDVMKNFSSKEYDFVTHFSLA